MISGYKLYQKLNFKLSKLLTWMLKGSFGSFGTGSIIFFSSRIDNPAGMFLGSGVLIYSGCWLNVVRQWGDSVHDARLTIGDRTIISHGAQISAALRIDIGSNVGVGKNVTVVDHLHDYTVIDQPILYAPLSPPGPIVIEDDAFIANNCVIAPGVTIGRHSFIGANSVVLGDVPPLCMAAGNPARVLRRYDSDKKVWQRA